MEITRNPSVNVKVIPPPVDGEARGGPPFAHVATDSAGSVAMARSRSEGSSYSRSRQSPKPASPSQAPSTLPVRLAHGHRQEVRSEFWPSASLVSESVPLTAVSSMFSVPSRGADASHVHSLSSKHSTSNRSVAAVAAAVSAMQSHGSTALSGTMRQGGASSFYSNVSSRRPSKEAAMAGHHASDADAGLRWSSTEDESELVIAEALAESRRNDALNRGSTESQANTLTPNGRHQLSTEARHGSEAARRTTHRSLTEMVPAEPSLNEADARSIASSPLGRARSLSSNAGGDSRSEGDLREALHNKSVQNVRNALLRHMDKHACSEEDAFRLLDINHDGLISASEMQNAMRRMGVILLPQFLEEVMRALTPHGLCGIPVQRIVTLLQSESPNTLDHAASGVKLGGFKVGEKVRILVTTLESGVLYEGESGSVLGAGEETGTVRVQLENHSTKCLRPNQLARVPEPVFHIPPKIQKLPPSTAAPTYKRW